MPTIDYTQIVVRKPWGYEYLVFENKLVALWALHINGEQRTSMHCHPRKKTGLMVSNGEVEVSFLTDSMVLSAGSKTMIRMGLFHSTTALSKNATVLEIETPPLKEDLVRLDDSYGRKAQPYEGRDKFIPRSEFDEATLWITEDMILKANTESSSLLPALTFHFVPTLEVFRGQPAGNLVTVLRGGLLASGGPLGVSSVLGPGDIVSGTTLKLLTENFELAPHTFVAILSRKDL